MWLVLQKELKELLRDRKTLFFMIALPLLLFPLIFGAAAYFSGKAFEEAQSKVLTYAIVGADYAQDLSARLAQSDQFELKALTPGVSLSQAVKTEVVDFAIAIPANYSTDILNSGQLQIKLYLNDAELNLVFRRVEEIVAALATEYQQNAFAQLQLSRAQQQGLIQPIVVDKVNVADKRESWGEKIGGLIPYLVFLLCLQGAMFPATDLGAGEKERGTLETLLISPIERHKIVLGKFFTIAFAGITSALVTVVSMAAWGILLSQGMAVKLVAEFMASISVIDFVLMFFMLIPVVAIFASVLLSLSIYARSFKEAQGYMSPLMLLVIIPVFLAMLPGVTLEGGWAWVPLTNVALAIKELIKGTMDYLALFAIFSSTAVIALAFIAFCVYWFSQEKVLFR